MATCNFYVMINLISSSKLVYQISAKHFHHNRATQLSMNDFIGWRAGAKGIVWCLRLLISSQFSFRDLQFYYLRWCDWATTSFLMGSVGTRRKDRKYDAKRICSYWCVLYSYQTWCQAWGNQTLNMWIKHDKADKHRKLILVHYNKIIVEVKEDYSVKILFEK